MAAGAVDRKGITRGLLGVVAALFVAGPVAPAAGSGFYNQAQECVDTSRPYRFIPPVEGASFEVRLAVSGVGIPVGENLQADLIARNAQGQLHTGLGSGPVGFEPRRIPIYVSAGRFDAPSDEGATPTACDDPGVNAIVVRGDRTRGELARTTAHELFHAYSYGVPPVNLERETPWYEEAAATWSEWRMGFGEPAEYDNELKHPQTPLDARTPARHPYAMWRFVQFLDDGGLVRIGGDWVLHRDVIRGYEVPGATRQLELVLEASGTSLADQLGAFWGSRIVERPPHKPVLRLSPERAVRIRTGRTTIEPKAKPLGTWYRHFQLADGVKRVEFEFEPKTPTEDGRFWGATSPRDTERFFPGDSVAFCVGRQSGLDRKWPTRGFPVTFTNGAISGPVLKSEIDVFAQRDAEQCEGPEGNRACQLLSRANVNSLLGQGGFPFYSQGERLWRCVFVNRDESREVDLIVRRAKPNADLRELRRRFRATLEQGGFTMIPEGDVAGMITTDAEGTVVHTVLMLVGREVYGINLYAGSAGEVQTLAGRISGVVG